nr:alkane hydroxylase MAH1-like [Ipomoea trifida]
MVIFKQHYNIVVCTMLCIILCLAFLRKIVKKSRGSSVPTNWPVIGMLPAILKNAHRLHDFTTELLRGGGGTFELKGPAFANLDMLVTCDPSNINYIHNKNFTNYPKGTHFRKIFEICGDGIINTDSEIWALHRKTTIALMNHGRFRRSLERAVSETVENGLLPVLDRYAQRGEYFDLQEILKRLSFDLSCQVFLGKNPGSLCIEPPGDHPFRKAINDATNAILYRHILPERCWKLQKWVVGIDREKKLAEATDTIDKFIYTILSQNQDEKAGFTQYIPSENQEQDKIRFTSYIPSENQEREMGFNQYIPSENQEHDETGFLQYIPSENQEHDKTGFAQYIPSENQEHDKVEFTQYISSENQERHDKAGFTQNIPSGNVYGFSSWSSLQEQQHEDEANFSMLPSLLKAYEGNSKRFLRDTLVSLTIAAGGGTSSAAITWLFWLLAKNPLVEAKILDEINLNHLKQNRVFKVEQCQNLVYLHAAFCESLRLFPPVPMNHKLSLEKDILPSGHKVNPNTRIITSFYSLGRMESIWGKDYMEFKPERWISDTGGIKHVSSYNFPIFNLGPRTCLGKEMFFLVAKTVAANIILHYHCESLEPHSPVQYSDTLVLELKHGFKVKLNKRT